MNAEEKTRIENADVSVFFGIEDYSLTRSIKITENTLHDKPAEIARQAVPIELAKQDKQIEPAENHTEPEAYSAKRISGNQRRASLEEYKNSFLNTPKITDRKTVYLSRETRDRLDEVVRRLGERGASVSGFIENMARHHLDIYRDEIEQWKKL